MKIIHLSTNISKNSACKRISDSLEKIGLEGDILTLKSNEDYANKVSYSIISRGLNYIEYLLKKIINSNRDYYISTNIFGADDYKNYYIKDSNIVHIHWINGGFFSLNSLIKLNKKIVWTCHDSWAFTGICHVRNECDYYQKGCDKCKRLRTGFKSLSKYIYNKKRILYTQKEIYFVFPSSIHKQFALQSNLFSNVDEENLFVIGNPICTDIFFDECFYKESNEIVLGFGAIGGIKNIHKGINDLKEVLRKIHIKEKINIKLIIFGSNDFDEINKIFFNKKIVVINKGVIKEQSELRKVYSEIDIFISPSVEESFGQTVAESMACGCLGISYKNTGCVDIIENGINGYLAEYKDINSLKKCIESAIVKILNGYERKLSSEYIHKKFNENKIAKEYIKVYKKILKN